MSRTPYSNLWERLMANTHEPEHGTDCWRWAASGCRTGYGRFNLYVPGLREKVRLTAHVAAFVWLHGRPAGTDEFYLMYLEFRESGLELDHTCVEPACVNPDHADPVTPSVNCYRRGRR